MKKIISLVVLYPLCIAIFYTATKHNFSSWYKNPKSIYFAISFVGFLFLFYKKMLFSSFYSTLRHELCHWLFSVLSFSKPHSIQINPDGSGHYQHIGKGNYFLTLAPYFFPITSFSLLLASVVFQKPITIYFIIMGLALAFDVVSMFKDYHFQQTDWNKNGILFSVQFSVLMFIIMLMFYFTILFGGFHEAWNLIKTTFFTIKKII